MKLNEFVKKLFHKNYDFQLVDVNGEITLGAKIDVLQLQQNVNGLAIDFHNLVENMRVKEFDSDYTSDIIYEVLNMERQATLDEFIKNR